MKSMFALVASCLLCSYVSAATNTFYDSSMTYPMTGLVQNVTLTTDSHTPPALESVLLTIPTAVTNRVTIQLLRGSAVYTLWDSQVFVGNGVAYYFDKGLKIIRNDTVRVTKTATNAATVIFNWK